MKTLTAAEQVASHLRNDIKQGRWEGLMPGRDRLARELGVHGSTVERALGQLERESLIRSGGPGKRRRIVTQGRKTPGNTRVVITLYEPEDVLNPYIIELQSHLQAAGYRLSFASKTLGELKHDPKRVLSMLKSHPAEAWIVIAGGRALLETLSQVSTPTFALFGRFAGLPMAGTGPKKIEALRQCIDHLHGSGARRFVMLTRAERIKSGMGSTERAMFDELEKRGIATSQYNLPDWENTPEGLHNCLERLFQVTPPDVILVDDWMLSFAIQNYLSHSDGPAFRRAICVSTDYHPSLKWCRPGIPHFYWDPVSMVRRVGRWVDHVAQGKRDINKRPINARYVSGG